MARVLVGEEGEAGRWRMWRFQLGTLEMILDGRPWILTAGEDYPPNLPIQKLRSRLSAAAWIRGGTARVMKIDDDHIQVMFLPRIERPKPADEVPTP